MLALAALILLGGAAALASEPRRQIGWALALGRPVTLVGEKGTPRYHRWELDEVRLTTFEDADGAAGFQTQTISLLELAPDTRSDRYRLSADLLHASGTAADSRVGVYLGPTTAAAPTGERLGRWYGFEFTEFPPRGQSRPGLVGFDHVTLRARGATGVSNAFLAPVYRFQPANSHPTPWRQIVLDVSPASLTVSWRLPDGSLAEAASPTAESRAAASVTLLNQFGPPHYPQPLPVPDWSPRGPVGVYARNAGIAFRNVRLEPSPAAPPR